MISVYNRTTIFDKERQNTDMRTTFCDSWGSMPAVMLLFPERVSQSVWPAEPSELALSFAPFCLRSTYGQYQAQITACNALLRSSAIDFRLYFSITVGVGFFGIMVCLLQKSMFLPKEFPGTDSF